jgi:tetratricopeptide (TPR) repeat protein
VAAALGAAALVVFLLAWQARVRPLPVAGGILGLVLVFIGAGGMLGTAPLHRLQALWFEGRGQYGLALSAYEASGDSLAQSQDLARISVEWAEQLSAGHNYGAAVAQLEPVARLYKRDAGLVTRAETDLIQDYLAWGDQARQQGAFSAALAHYQALQQAAYCAAACQARAHEHIAQALLGLAQQLTTNKQYDQAVATYQQIVQTYSDTPEVEQANEALTLPQPLTGKLIYANKTPAPRFQVLLASHWSFNASTQVFTLLGQQYRAQTDASGLFTMPAVAVGQTYMIAWVDTSGHAGTCYTTNNQPLYKVDMRPLRAADAGSINIECV